MVTIDHPYALVNQSRVALAASFFLRNWNLLNDPLPPVTTPEVARSTYVVRNFTEMKYGDLFIFGAVGGNSSDSKIWDHFRVYGLLDNSKYGKSNLSCCLLYEHENVMVIKAVAPISKRNFIVRSSMWNFHVACPNIAFETGLVPTGVAVTINATFTCSERDVTYVKPYLPMKQPGKIALSTKTSYGNVSAEQIIEWMEAYKYLGVDKVVTYFIRSINEDALKVLKYYASTGFLDLYFYEPANEEKYPRIDNFPKKISQRWNDQATVVDDSFEIMSGYGYFGIIDHDEYFIPSNNQTLKQLLRQLEKLYLDSAGFIFKAQYYFISWGKSRESDLILGSYTRREDTQPRLDSNKNIYHPERVALGGMDTHVIHAAKGYKMYALDAEFGYIRHFRKCRPEQKAKKRCLFETKRIMDDEVVNWALAFTDNIRRVRRTVLGIE